MGAHTRGYNNKGYGVSYIGDYSTTLPEPFTLALVRNRFLRCAVAGARLQANYTVHGHRQMGHTKCPGDALFQEIETWHGFKVSKELGGLCPLCCHTGQLHMGLSPWHRPHPPPSKSCRPQLFSPAAGQSLLQSSESSHCCPTITGIWSLEQISSLLRPWGQHYRAMFVPWPALEGIASAGGAGECKRVKEGGGWGLP